ncbi:MULTISPECIES: choice-of-anchor L domain-containing protein [unclassified Flavobacterium]|uniref:choice-of-anchor L domain-containing protein n=1 Tax=unclassified Flavobacterium TaxID=196869 RepID=UPI001291168C|nr:MULTISPECIES: choice-of-anchor L domain-containing protein [unclassified Flavobacterium]MQP52658.1 T9SS type B sorting domain-containing protein [Flavobacterium sp. LMO9]MQP62162.1 T9SS type B sorting domain-containing protein [Flavobacterium sp. LMO6]
MRKILFIFAIFYSSCLFSQAITVDNTTNSPAQLVDLLLGNSCVEVSNISVSSTQSVAYFNQNGSAFPISEGIIIRNGIATHTQGPYTGVNLSSSVNLPGDPFLQSLSDSNGGVSPIVDAEYLEFDFIPLSNSFSFNFLFASNEYGFYQCEFSDVFAFELTNLTSGISNNLAVIPGTNTPVSVTTIRNSIYNDPSSPNNSCASVNPTFFGIYNVPNPTSSLNMRGQTVVMNASSVVVPNTPYRIRLIIGDYGNSGFDSAVFIAAGSFSTTLDLGPDQIICTGDAFELNTNLDNSFTYTWFENGNPILGETNPSYTVTTAGIYTVEAVRGSCLITDTVVFTDLLVTNPQDLLTCDTGAASYNFNLTTNDEVALGIDSAIYDVFYYESPADIIANNPIPSGNLSTYPSLGSQTIYIKIFNAVTGNFCDATYSFDLIVTNPVVATQPNPITVCEGQGNTSYAFTSLTTTEVLNGQSAVNYTVTYYNSVAEATSGTSPITSVSIPSGTTTVTVGIRIQDNSNSNCFDVTSVDITVNPLPIVDAIPDPVECSQFQLPTIVNGTYYLLPGGPTTSGQVQLNAGDIIDLSGTYYIFAGPDANGCTNESSFNAYFIDEYVPLLDHCGVFTVPSVPYNIGDFYTAPGGPLGTGVIVPAGTEYPNTTFASFTVTLYHYAEVNGLFCRDEQFVFYVHPLPLVDDPADVVSCDNYILPPLVNGNYFSAPNGLGTPLFAGDVISVNGPNFPGTYYVYNQLAHITSSGAPGSCPVENPFQIDLVDTSVFTAVSGCGIYTLPTVSFGGYFTAPNGGGTPITDLDITASQVVYYYTNTTTLPNCTSNLNYNITVNPLPLVDTITSDVYCGEFILPVLTNGTYFTLSGGPSIIGQQQLNAGDRIDLSGVYLSPGTYYIYNGPDSNNCENESSFTIALNPFPPADNYASRTECLPYSIPTPVNGTVYTALGGPLGGGSVVSSSEVFTATQTFYLYNIDTSTGCEINLPFTITYNGINLPDYQNVNVCEFENYQLPALTHVAPTPFNYTIGYFYDPNGVNPVPPGTVFNTPNTTTTIYVYAVNGDRIICTQEDSFDIIVSETPNLAALGLVFDNEECGTYVLPTLPITAYTIGYYSQSGGNAADLITNLNISAPGTYTYYVYASAIGNPNCNDEISFTFTVHPLLDITIQGGIICVDSQTGDVLRTFTMNSGLNPAFFTVNWFLNGTLVGTGPSYTASQAGTYTVEFIKLTPDVGANCNYNSTTVTIVQSGPAVADFTVSTPFENNTFITVNLTGGYGDYLYQLVYPNGTVTEYQSSNVFTNLSTGEYYITIYDVLGECNPTFLGPIYIINYPNYFSPNTDGVNDNWNIWDLRHQPDAIISIFDRYGKFIKQISPAGSGWDGTLNGERLPSTDYWFTVKYLPQNGTENQIFRAHFSLIR